MVTLLSSELERMHEAGHGLTDRTLPAGWGGPAASSADRLRRRLAGGVEELAIAMDLVRRTAVRVCDSVTELTRLVDEADELARTYGFTIADDGSLRDHHPHTGYAPHEPGSDQSEREHVRAALRQRIAQVVQSGDALDLALFDTLTAAKTALLPAAVDTLPIPPPPPPPPQQAGDGAGSEHGSEPWLERGDELAKRELATLLALAAELRGYDHSAEHLNHYLGNSGDPLELDPDLMARELPLFREDSDRLARRVLVDGAYDLLEAGRYGEPIQVQTDWALHYVYKAQNPDWYFAVGGFSYSLTGVMTLHPPVGPSAPPTVELDYQIHVYDRYNYDAGKGVTIGNITVHDADLASLHRAGVAQEFEMSGSSQPRHYVHNLQTGSDYNLPPPAEPGADRAVP